MAEKDGEDTDEIALKKSLKVRIIGMLIYLDGSQQSK